MSLTEIAEQLKTLELGLENASVEELPRALGRILLFKLQRDFDKECCPEMDRLGCEFGTSQRCVLERGHLSPYHMRRDGVSFGGTG